jgi:hypothetical protein
MCPSLSIDMRCDEIEGTECGRNFKIAPAICCFDQLALSSLLWMRDQYVLRPSVLASAAARQFVLEDLQDHYKDRRCYKLFQLHSLHIVLLTEILKSRYTLGDNRQICRCMLSYVGRDSTWEFPIKWGQVRTQVQMDGCNSARKII